jgi:hypothetical protein
MSSERERQWRQLLLLFLPWSLWAGLPPSLTQFTLAADSLSLNVGRLTVYSEYPRNRDYDADWMLVMRKYSHS